MFCHFNGISIFFLFNKTPLIVASDNGETEIVRLLLEMPGINVNHKDIFN